jgi:flavorubredoxin
MFVREVAPNITALMTALARPGAPAFAASAFLLDDGEPMLVDTGSPLEVDELVKAVEQRVDLEDLRWIWLSHADDDHSGGIGPLLERAPNATVVLTFTTMGYLSVSRDAIPLDRVRIVAPGERATLGGRDITAVRPPTFDRPGTVGVIDHGTGAFFSVDFLGALLPSLDDVLADDAAAVDPEDLAFGMRSWAGMHAPWVPLCDQKRFDELLEAVWNLQPSVVCSTHGPPVRGTLDRALEVIGTLPGSEPFPEPGSEMIEPPVALAPDTPEATTSA